MRTFVLELYSLSTFALSSSHSYFQLATKKVLARYSGVDENPPSKTKKVLAHSSSTSFRYLCLITCSAHNVLFPPNIDEFLIEFGQILILL